MKILIIDTYYPKFLKTFNNSNPKVKKQSYKVHRDKLLKIYFGTSDFFSYNLKKLGHEVEDLILNDEILQKKWAKENKLEIRENCFFSKIQSLPYIYRFVGRPKWVQEIAIAQIKKFKPDVVYMQDLSILNPSTLKYVKKYCRLLVGQIASPLPPEEYLKRFDLIITSFPHYVKKLRKLGIKSEYQKLAFEPRMLKNIKNEKRIYDISFVGSFTPYHKEGTKVLEEVARHFPIHVWGQGIEYLSVFSPLRKNYHGEAWGKEMYKIIAKSKIVLNRHIGASEKYANNMRIYETTGMGALLITDHKQNLEKIFKIGKEVVSYKNTKELILKISHYLKNQKEQEEIAKAGQKRTLLEHSYPKRMEELVNILRKYI